MFLTTDPLSMLPLIEGVSSTEHGAIITFSGTVRDTEKEVPLSSITYEAYAEMAEKEITDLITAMEKKWRVKISLRHRVGIVPAGEASLIAVCAGVHRKETFAACEELINRFKEKIPVWKVTFTQ